MTSRNGPPTCSSKRWTAGAFRSSAYRLHVVTDEDAEAGTRSVTEQLRQAGIQMESVHEEAFSLEDVFIAVVEKARAHGKFAEED